MNRATPSGGRFTGWFKDDITPAAKLYLNGTLVATVSGNDVTLADALTVDGAQTFTGVVTIGPVATGYAMPTAKGSAGQQLTTNGSKVVTWATA